jgi:hypothetical protein
MDKLLIEIKSELEDETRELATSKGDYAVRR